MSGRRIAVVTGTRAEFGLLAPVMRAIDAHPGLELEVLVTGTHLLPPARTITEVQNAFPVTGSVEMQRPGATGRAADAEALGRGISGFAEYYRDTPPDVVLVLGDRIEALAAATAAAVGGIRVAHVHGGDRAEGIADESMRHAISKLAHLHFPASPGSGDRLLAMGEEANRIHVVGSPAIDGMASIPALDDATYAELDRPDLVFLLHPLGRPDDEEARQATAILDACRRHGTTLALHPNHDPGRTGIVRAIEAGATTVREHLDRAMFLGLLRRVDALVGNSSAGLIEAAALPTWSVDIGRRQSGREKPANVISCPDPADDGFGPAIDAALARTRTTSLASFAHPYGDGRTGFRIAERLASFDSDKCGLIKRNTY